MEHLLIQNASPDLSFPWRLYLMLRDAEVEFPNIVGWIQQGRAFQVYNIKMLERSILSTYFCTTKYASFRRQLQSYGFQPLGKRGQYMHPQFSRHDPQGCERVVRGKKKGKAQEMVHEQHQKLHQPSLTGNANYAAPHMGVTGGGTGSTRVSPDLQPVMAAASQAFSSIQNAMGEIAWMMPSLSAFSPSTSVTPPAASAVVGYISSGQNTSSDSSTNNTSGQSDDDDGSSDDDDNMEPLSFDDSADESSSMSSGRRSVWSDTEDLLAEFVRQYLPDHSDEGTRNSNLREEIEPRTIEHMVSKPNLLYEYSPSMTPEVQAIIEQLLPVCMPVGYYAMEISWWGHFMAWFVVFGHSFETICTNFGGHAWYLKDIIGPIQHASMDLLWNHMLISIFMLLGSPVFGPYCQIVAVCQAPTLPIMICADFKTHFLAHILKPSPSSSSSVTTTETQSSSSSSTHDDKERPPPPSTESIEEVILKHRMGDLLTMLCLYYIVATALMAVSVYIGNTVAQALAVFFFNMAPIITDLSYGKAFGSRLRMLPLKQRTVFEWVLLRTFPRIASLSHPRTTTKLYPAPLDRGRKAKAQ